MGNLSSSNEQLNKLKMLKQNNVKQLLHNIMTVLEFIGPESELNNLKPTCPLKISYLLTISDLKPADLLGILTQLKQIPTPSLHRLLDENDVLNKMQYLALFFIYRRLEQENEELKLIYPES